MGLISDAQAVVFLALSIAGFLLTLYAFVDAARRPSAAFPYAGKRTKTFWTAILGVAAAVAFVASAVSVFLLLISVVAAGIYLADVRPAVRLYRPGSGRGTGPYGGW